MFSAALRHARVNLLGLTLQQAAEITGYSKFQLCRYEQGHVNVKIAQAEDIATKLGFTLPGLYVAYLGEACLVPTYDRAEAAG